MAVKKTVKKRRTGKKAASLESVMDILHDVSDLSAVNKRATARLHKAASSLARQEKLITAQDERIAKTRAAVAAAKSPGAKEKAKVRLAAAVNGLKEAKLARRAAITEQKKAERLLRGLHKTLETARNRMAREYDRAAQTLEKSIDKPPRRRKARSSKAAASTDKYSIGTD